MKLLWFILILSLAVGWLMGDYLDTCYVCWTADRALATGQLSVPNTKKPMKATGRES
jgi:hypothetical protein